MLLDIEHTPPRLPSRSLLSQRWMAPFKMLASPAPAGGPYIAYSLPVDRASAWQAETTAVARTRARARCQPSSGHQ